MVPVGGKPPPGFGEIRGNLLSATAGMATPSRASGTPLEGVETSGEFSPLITALAPDTRNG